MTKEEAKLVLDNARPQTKEIDRQFYDDEDLNNALDMAIKALSLEELQAMRKEMKSEIYIEDGSDPVILADFVLKTIYEYIEKSK